MNIQAFAKAVKAYRKRLGLVQTELAERIGVRQQTVGKWETAKIVRAPSIQAVTALQRLSPELFEEYFDLEDIGLPFHVAQTVSEPNGQRYSVEGGTQQDLDQLVQQLKEHRKRKVQSINAALDELSDGQIEMVYDALVTILRGIKSVKPAVYSELKKFYKD